MVTQNAQSTLWLHRMFGLKQFVGVAGLAFAGSFASTVMAASVYDEVNTAVTDSAARTAIVQREVTAPGTKSAVSGLAVSKKSATVKKAAPREAEQVHAGHRQLHPNAGDATEPIATF